MKIAFFSIALFISFQAGVSSYVADKVGAEITRDFAPLNAIFQH